MFKRMDVTSVERIFFRSVHRSDDCTSMTTLDKPQTNSTGKTPHSWVNTWRYYSFSPTYPMSNPYSTWTRPHSDKRRSSRHKVRNFSLFPTKTGNFAIEPALGSANCALYFNYCWKYLSLLKAGSFHKSILGSLCQ